MDQRRTLGGRGEDHAAQELRSSGWRILARNARTRYGEIDLIAIERETLVFVEVKTLRAEATRGPELPSGSVRPQKTLRIRRLAAAWLAENGGAGWAEIRFDVIGVHSHRSGRIE